MSEVPAAPAAAAEDAPRNRWAVLGVLVAGLSMIVLDGTIVGVALPTIITDLSLELNQAQWVNSLYSVIFAALLLGAGRLGDRFGRRRLFIVGVALFSIGSVLAALSDSATGLIAARAVQGIGGAAVLPSTLSSVNAAFREPRERAAAFGVWGAVISGMAAVGPLLGGAITTHLAWPWIFWINLPLGAAVIVGAVLLTPETRAGSDTPGFDLLGLLASAVGFGLVVFAVIEGPSLGWLHPSGELNLLGLRWGTQHAVSIVPILLAIGVLSLVGFVLLERSRGRRGQNVVLDLSLFRLRTFSWGNLTAGTVAVGEFGLLFALPLYLVNALGLSAMAAGWVLAAMALGAFVAGAQARHVAARIGPPGVVVIGLGLEVIGVGFTALVLGPDTSPFLIAAALVGYGVGLGFASAQLTSTVLARVPLERSGQASATQSTVRQIGAALGTAVAGSALAGALAVTLPRRLAEIPALAAGSADALVTATVSSAGGNLAGLREGEPRVADALTAGFAQGSAVAIGIAGLFLILGLVGAVVVLRADRTAAGEASGRQSGSPTSHRAR